MRVPAHAGGRESDETGRVPDDRRPDEVAIRRALAECMTVGDIDDAMGWSPGTARRRRWLAVDDGGLPASDAELGGVVIWFRSTIEDWRAAPDRPATPDRPAVPDPPDRDTCADGAESADPAEAVPPDVPDGPAAVGESEGVEPVDEAGEPAPDVEPDQPPHDQPGKDRARTAGSGFAFEIGQSVHADVHGGWRDARVAHRDRATVVVEYRVNATPLGVRRQRIAADRVRLPPDQE